jgi:hypothetical protein
MLVVIYCGFGDSILIRDAKAVDLREEQRQLLLFAAESLALPLNFHVWQILNTSLFSSFICAFPLQWLRRFVTVSHACFWRALRGGGWFV